MGCGEAHGCVEVHHLGDGVGAEDFVDGVCLDGDDSLAFGYEHGGDVGEVELAVGVVGVEGVEFVEEGVGVEAIDAGVDLIHFLGRIELLGAEGLLFDDGDDFRAVCGGAKDAAVSGGVGGYRGEDGHGGVLAEVGVADGGDGFRANEGHVAGEDEKVLGEWSFIEGEEGFEHLHGVAGAALLSLEDELDAGVLDGGLHTVGFVADDAEDVVYGDYLFCSGDDMEEESAASDLVEDFGTLAFEPRAFACGHDGDGEACMVHDPYGLMVSLSRKNANIRYAGFLSRWNRLHS